MRPLNNRKNGHQVNSSNNVLLAYLNILLRIQFALGTHGSTTLDTFTNQQSMRQLLWYVPMGGFLFCVYSMRL